MRKSLIWRKGWDSNPRYGKNRTPDFESDQRKKSPENQGTRNLATACGTNPRHNFGTTSGQEKSLLCLAPFDQARQLFATALGPCHERLGCRLPLLAVGLHADRRPLEVA